jgi:hypothetical protein
MVHLTLASSCVWRRLGAELSTSSVDRRTTMGARRASFGVSSSANVVRVETLTTYVLHEALTVCKN